VSSLEKTLVISYRLSIVMMSLSVAVWLQFSDNVFETVLMHNNKTMNNKRGKPVETKTTVKTSNK